MNVPGPFLKDKNFLIMMMGTFVNAIGNGIYLVTGMLLVIQLSGSVLYSGFAVFAISSANVLAFLIAPLANYAKYKNGLIYSNLIKSMMLMTIPLMHFTVGLNVWYVIVLLFVTSLISQYAYPIESTILPMIVGEENIIQANSYLQTVREAMDIVFIASAGIIVALIGSVQAIIVTAVCILGVSILYMFIEINQDPSEGHSRNKILEAASGYFSDLQDGFRYIKHSLIPKMMVSIIFVNIAMAMMMTNLPAFSLIKGNGLEAVYGFYLASLSFGIMVGTLISPKVKGVKFGNLIIMMFTVTGVLWIGASLLPVIPSMVMFSTGAVSIGILNILVFSAIQKQVESIYIGRVVTLLTSSASLGVPLGALIGGMLGEAFSPVVPFVICGIAMILFSFMWIGNSILRKLPAIEQVELFHHTKKATG